MLVICMHKQMYTYIYIHLYNIIHTHNIGVHHYKHNLMYICLYKEYVRKRCGACSRFIPMPSRPQSLDSLAWKQLEKMYRDGIQQPTSCRDLEPTQGEPTQTNRDYEGLTRDCSGLLGFYWVWVGSPWVGS